MAILPAAGELAGVRVGEVWVSASGVPAEFDDMLGALVHLDFTPVLDAQPQGGVADARVDASFAPAGDEPITRFA